MKLFSLTVFILLSAVAFSQKIELLAKVEGLKNEKLYFLRPLDNGFILSNPFYIQVYSQSNQVLITKEWKTVPFKEIKYTEKEEKNTVPVPDFNPFAAEKIEEGYLVYVNYKPSSGTAMVLEYKFTEKLDFVSERVLTKINKRVSDSKDFAFTALDFFKSPDSDYYVFAQYSISSKKTGYQHAFEYQILDFDFNVVRSGSMNMPSYKPNVPDYQVEKTVIRSIEVLDSGDPLINLGGALYFIEENQFIPLELSPSKTITTYKLRQNSNGDLALIGAYSDKNDTRHTGYVVIHFDENLSIKSEEYGVFSENFYLTATEHINKTLPHAANNKNELGLKTKGALLHKLPASLIDAKFEVDGTIKVVFLANARYGNAGGCPQNVAIVKFDQDGNIMDEYIFPFEFTDHQNFTVMQKHKVLFQENSLTFLTTDYPQNYDEKGFYYPTLTPISFFSGKCVTVVLGVNFDNNTTTRKRLKIEEDKDFLEVPTIIETSKFPVSTEFTIITRVESKKSISKVFVLDFD